MKFSTGLKKVKDKLFENIHGNHLIYNTCWEDPRVDRNLLNLNEDSSIVMITSAGCNALDYLLDNPSSIDCIDLNKRQNALLNLKIALFKEAHFFELFEFFGNGKYAEAKDLYESRLRSHLPEDQQAFWDDKIEYFTGTAQRKKSFYYRGTSGQFAWLFSKYLNSKPKAKQLLNELLAAESLNEQQEIYKELEPKLFNKLAQWLINRQITMNLLGVPQAQKEMITEHYEGGVFEYVTDSLNYIFTQLPISDNYFWYVYIKGKYSRNCCPEYLVEKNFAVLKKRVSRISTHTTSVSDFLEKKPGNYTHFVLLDHQDWLAAYNKEELEREWNLILHNSSKGAKYLLRSAHINPDFIPQFVLEQCTVETESVAEHKTADRVGTYVSTIVLTRN